MCTWGGVGRATGRKQGQRGQEKAETLIKRAPELHRARNALAETERQRQSHLMRQDMAGPWKGSPGAWGREVAEMKLFGQEF